MAENLETFIINLQKTIETQKSEIFKLRAIINSIPGSIYWKDKHGKYLGRNLYSAEKMLDVSSEGKDHDIDAIINKTDYDLFERAVADQYRKHDLQVLQTGKELVTEEVVTIPSNEIITQLSIKRPLRDEYGNIMGIIGNTVDISHLKKIENDLKKTKEELEASVKIKDDFIHNMEHDIRTPFTGILGLTEYLFNQEQEQTKKEYLRDIISSVKQLLNYCNSILDYSKIEMDSIPVTQKKFIFKEFMENLLAVEKPAAITKNLNLTYEQDPKIPTIVIGDQYRLQRILINLLSNAIKFTFHGEVAVKTTLLKQQERELIIGIAIKDTGIGIPEDKINYIYEKFYRDSPANKGIFSGLGLGLKIVKHFVEDLGGEIEIQSQQNKGTIFCCTLPFKIPLVEELLYE